MKIVDPSFSVLSMPNEIEALQLIEKAYRVCYKSEDTIGSIKDTSNFVCKFLGKKHETPIEHCSITLKIICDRGVSHELVRHRLASYSQESTRYANYSKDKFGNEISVIRPMFWKKDSSEYRMWEQAMVCCESMYMNLLQSGAKAQEARSVLPNSLKTEIIITANIREWRHIFKLRCSQSAHPQMRQVMIPILLYFNSKLPSFFKDVVESLSKEVFL